MNDSLIRLECKSKFNEYISKTSAKLSREEYDKILQGDYSFLLDREERVCQELYCYNKTKLLKPVVVVEYMREAYVYQLGNVRITFDKDIASSVTNIDMFSDTYATTKVLPNDRMVLEIKYDDFIPSHILQILQTAMTERCAISKYVMCREKKRMVQLL